MNSRSSFLPYLLSGVLALSLVACDQSSQNIDFQEGSNLTVDGPAQVTLEGYRPDAANRDTAEYMVRAYTVNNEYNWTVSDLSGGDDLGTPGEPDYGRRDQGNEGNPEVVGEYSEGPRTYEVTVTTTIDGDEYSGSAMTKVDYPSLSDQLQTQTANRSQNYSVARTSLTTTGLRETFDSDGAVEDANLFNGWTAFVPSDQAFVDALDSSGNGSLEEDERPPTGVLAQLLQYHVVQDSLTETEVTGQTVSTVLHPDEEITLDPTGIQATNTTAELDTTDIAASDGVAHLINTVLLPSSLVSIVDQDVVRDSDSGIDSVFVEGTLVYDGGFVALHEDGPDGDIIGVSDYLEASTGGDPGAGFHNEIGIELNSQLSSDTTTVVAMPHRDTDNDQAFNFDPNAGQDVPYFWGGGSTPVTDAAAVTVPQ